MLKKCCFMIAKCIWDKITLGKSSLRKALPTISSALRRRMAYTLSGSKLKQINAWEQDAVSFRFTNIFSQRGASQRAGTIRYSICMQQDNMKTVNGIY